MEAEGPVQLAPRVGGPSLSYEGLRVRVTLLGTAGRVSRRVGNAAPFGRDTGRGINVIGTDIIPVKEEAYCLSSSGIPAARPTNCAERCTQAAFFARVQTASKHEEVCE